jgi:hypothetical protein
VGSAQKIERRKSKLVGKYVGKKGGNLGRNEKRERKLTPERRERLWKDGLKEQKAKKVKGENRNE